MLEPISASLGIAGFGFSLFATCIKGFLLLSSAKNLSKDASTLRCMLHLEEYRLVQWAEKAGLLNKHDGEGGELNERLNKGLIEETLTELATLLTDVDALKRRYNLVVSAEKPGRLAGGGGGRNRSLFAQAVSPKKRTQILTRAKLLVDGLPKRLWWVVAEKEDFEKMVRQIGFFVQRLVDLLDDQQQEVMRNDIRVLLLNVVAMNDKLEELRAIKTSVEMVVGEDSPIASSAAVKYLRMELEDEAPPAPGGGGSPTPINYRKRNPLPTIHPTKITNKSGEGPRPPRETALYNTEDPESPPLPIYIEWKSINKQLRSKIRPRVENLAHLLHTPKHPSFRTLHCRGFFEDYEKAQYGFVFDRPHGADPARNPISLLQLFRLKGFQLPTQTMRMELACILATALSQLHSAGWLHKSLRADNILFFPTTITTPNGGGGAQLANSNKYSIDLTQPYLVGYEYARFDASSEVSEQPSSNPDHDIYRHPLAIGDYSESFNRIFDIYSLGLVFLEIAHWRPLRKII
ncbi:prion-inhibition and propagation-domain-containing protein, partial [Peziza echinospora]